jgi:hypothetical protein
MKKSNSHLRSPLVPLAVAVVTTLLVLGATPALLAQSFDAGSDGSLGDVVIDASTTIDLPPDGKLHYRSLTVAGGVRVTFRKNVRNTPVFILAQSDVVINGILDVSGTPQPSGIPTGGSGGPGGFDGGKPGFGELLPGNGYGPGAGRFGDSSCDGNTGAGGGAYGSRPNLPVMGPTYGNALLIPLVGGSGGGGTFGQPGAGGGGGGGAILIASSTRVAVEGAVEAFGGGGTVCLNSGSGGAIRLVAPKVEGGGRIDVRPNGNGGAGRTRIDTIDRSNIRFSFIPANVVTVGGNLLTFPSVLSRLDTIEVATNAIPVGSGPVTITLPFGSTPDRTVKIQARDFGRVVPISVVLTPDSGEPKIFDAEIDNTITNPAVLAVPVTFPVNTLVTVHCWTRKVVPPPQ